MSLDEARGTRSLALLLALCLLAPVAARAETIGGGPSGYIATDDVPYSLRSNWWEGEQALPAMFPLWASEESVTIPIGFDFVFYGASYSELSLSEDGLISFGGPSQQLGSVDLNSTAPDGDLPSIAVLWGEYYIDDGPDGAVYYETRGAEGDRELVVTWHNMFIGRDPLSHEPEFVSFQAVLFEASGEILFNYIDTWTPNLDFPEVDDGGRATVGVRGAGGHENGRVLQWSHHDPVIFSGRSLLFTPFAASDCTGASELVGTATRPLCAVTTLAAQTSTAVQLRAVQPMELDTDHAYDDAAADISLSGDGPLSGLVLMRRGADPGVDDELVFAALSLPSGATSEAGTRSVLLTDDEASPLELPAGDYVAYLIADGSEEVSVRLEFATGLGAAQYTPTLAADVEIVDLPVHLGTPQDAPPFEATLGATRSLDGPGLLLHALHMRLDPNAGSTLEECIYAGEPEDGFLPGCPGADDHTPPEYEPPTAESYDRASVGVFHPIEGEWAFGGSLSSPAPPVDYGGSGVWLSYLPEPATAPGGAAALVLLAILARRSLRRAGPGPR